MTQLWHGQHNATVPMGPRRGRVPPLPTQVFNMYHPEIGGNGSEFRIKVVDKP